MRLLVALNTIHTYVVQEKQTYTKFFTRNRAAVIVGSKICITKTSRPNRFFAVPSRDIGPFTLN